VMAAGSDAEQRAQASAAPAGAVLLAAGAPAGPPVSGNVVGLSVETWRLVELVDRTGPCDDNDFTGALHQLGRPPIRTGGNSQDRTVTRAGALPAGETDDPRSGGWYVATDRYFKALRCLAHAGAGQVTAGLNFRDAADARRMLTRLRREVPADQLEITLGNEPELFGAAGSGRPTVSPQRLLADYRKLREDLGAVPALRGPDFSTGRWLEHVPEFIAREHPQTVSVHAYPYENCRSRPGDPGWATAQKLLSRPASRGLIAGLAAPVQAATAAGARTVIGEINSVACGGLDGVSDEPVAALWAIDTILAAAAAGISAVQFHVADRIYDPLTLHGDKLVARPIWDGMVFAARQLQPGWRLAPDGTDDARVGSWAMIGPEGQRRSVAINRVGAAVRVAVASSGPAQVQTLARPDGGDPLNVGITTRQVVSQDGWVAVEVPAGGAVSVTAAS
jgi:hypothetical protein